ncbi:MAG: SOS response-associated peptidase [Steroidobacteraceae bacterium]|jgi:putative SOS response-associated peptidase YedK
MCGRYVSRDQAAIEREYDIRIIDPFEKIYNAAPTMRLPVLRANAAGWNCTLMQWGLIPAWWSKSEPPASTINARSEEAASKPMWRQAVRHNRCLVPASGWYEWQQGAVGARKQPFYIHAADNAGLCFAGLWSTHLREGVEAHTFAILTRAASEELAFIHHRMPLVLPSAVFAEWLDPGVAGSQELLDQAVGQSLTHFASYPVSAYVSSSRNQGERCIAPL